MTEDHKKEESDLTDSELLELLRNHGTDRRLIMKVLGAGSLLSLGTGSASANHDQPHTPHIDPHFGYSASADERLPGKLRPDHTVEFHTDEPPIPFHFEPMGMSPSESDRHHSRAAQVSASPPPPTTSNESSKNDRYALDE